MSFRSPSACPLLTGPAGEVLGIDIPLDSLGFQLNSDFSLSPRAAAKISDGSQYYVLLIITDGVISDMTQTKEAIVSVSLRRVWQEEVTVNNCPGVEILPYVQANKSACPTITDAGRRHGTPSETKVFISHGSNSSQSISIS